jgi:NOL1/NOP2/fmu family ribosome biogenesis protein
MLKDVCFVERSGVYFAKDEERGIRLSIEGTQILKDQIKKNVVELDEVEMQTWMMGHEVRKKTGLRGFVVLKHGNDFLGTGKASEEKITNFIPKSRRLKDRTIEE